jgi:hypothetical protein
MDDATADAAATAEATEAVVLPFCCSCPDAWPGAPPLS